MKDQTFKKEKLRPAERFESMHVAISELGDQQLPLLKEGISVHDRITESLVDEFTPEENDKKKSITAGDS